MLARLASLVPQGVRVPPDGLGECPAGPGAYALAIRLDAPLDFARRSMAARFAPGWYAYAGSANGPGGMRARLARHFRKQKALRWHVDELTIRAAELAALAVPGGSECAIAQALLASGSFTVPLSGFGSSDCATCAAHLLAYSE